MKPRCRCERCGTRDELTRHHIYPKRWFKRMQPARIMWLCTDCHGELELIINRKEKSLAKDKHLNSETCSITQLPSYEYLTTALEFAHPA